MLFNATGKRPLFIGKPEPAMPLYAVEKVRSERDPLVNKENTLVIGDRLYTDIACGINAGVETAVVFTGEAKKEDLNDTEFKPTYEFENIREFLNAVKK